MAAAGGPTCPRSAAESVDKQAEILTVFQNAAARCAQGTEAADCGLRAIKAGCWLHSSSGALPPGCVQTAPSVAKTWYYSPVAGYQLVST